jgi:translocator protein
LTQGLLVWVFIVFLTALTGSIASIDAGDFYGQLLSPSWAPPAWLFGPVWTLLYLMIALAGWLHWRAHGLRGHGTEFGLFGLQLILNALWSWLFFAWRLGGWALADILVLLATIAAIVVWFFRSGSRLAAILLLPYLLWVTFATALNWSLWQANPTLL